MSLHLRRNDDTDTAEGRQVLRYLKRTRATGLTLGASFQLRCWVGSNYVRGGPGHAPQLLEHHHHA